MKDNQPLLHEDIKTVFAELHDSRPRAMDEAAQPTGETHEDVDKGHGRVERRQVTVCQELNWITTAKKWKDLEAGRVRSQVPSQAIVQRHMLEDDSPGSVPAGAVGGSVSASACEVAQTRANPRSGRVMVRVRRTDMI